MSLRTVLLACGILSSALYVGAIDVLAPIVHPEYHRYAYQMVSELFAVGAPTRSLLAVPMALYNLLAFAFSIGVWVSAERRRVVRLTALALAVYAAISTAGFFLAAMDVGGPQGLTDRDVVHIAATAVQGVALVSAIGLGAFAHGPRFRIYSFTTLAVCATFAALAGFVATRGSSPWLGTTERVSIYAWMLWIGVLAAAFLRTRGIRGDAR